LCPYIIWFILGVILTHISGRDLVFKQQNSPAAPENSVGGAMMVPVGRLVVLREAPKENLLNAVAYITWPGLVAPVLGPPIGGFITTYASWRWIFFLNLPLGLFGVVLTAFLIKNSRADCGAGFSEVGPRHRNNCQWPPALV
jgi:MFS family permease